MLSFLLPGANYYCRVVVVRALMTPPRVVVPAVWLHARAHPTMCELRCASCARSRRTVALVCLPGICGACSRRDPAKTYSECVLGDTFRAWMLVSPRGLAQLNAEGVVALLDNEGNTVSFHTRVLRHFVEFHRRTCHCHPDAVNLRLRPLRSAHTGESRLVPPYAGNASGPAAAIVFRAPPAFLRESTAACSD